MNSPALKFRPSLTANEIAYLLDLLQSGATANNPTASSIAQSLHKFHLKAKHGIVSASHVATGKTDLGVSMGMGDDSTPEALFEIWKETPTVLNTAQLTKVAHYRYTTDRMSPTEEAAYECGQY